MTNDYRKLKYICYENVKKKQSSLSLIYKF